MLNSLRVKKTWFSALLLILMTVTMSVLYQKTAHAESTNPIPTQEYVVDDYAKMLTPSFKQKIIDQEKTFKQTKQQPQVVVMTIKSTNGQEIGDYANDLLSNQRWKFGKQGVDNGVLLLFAKNNGQNNVRVSTGYGVEGILPDLKIHQMFEDNAKLLKSSNNAEVNQGLENVFDSITKILMHQYANGNQSKATNADNQNGLASLPHPIFTVILVIFLCLIGVFLLIGFLGALVSNTNDNDDHQIDLKTVWNTNAINRLQHTASLNTMRPTWQYQNQYHGHLLRNVIIGVAGAYVLSQLIDHHHYHDHNDDNDHWGGFGGGGFFGGDDSGGFSGGDDGGFFDGGGGGDFGGGGDSF